MSDNVTLFKAYMVENYIPHYYKKLKKSLPDKIAKGEVEWIYSYGEKLIRSGNISVLKKVREIERTRECDNSYIPSEILYKKCVKISKKFRWIITF